MFSRFMHGLHARLILSPWYLLTNNINEAAMWARYSILALVAAMPVSIFGAMYYSPKCLLLLWAAAIVSAFLASVGVCTIVAALWMTFKW